MKYELNFTDNTIIEGKGEFNKIKDIMLKEDGVSEWMLRTELQMIIDYYHNLSEARFILHLYSDGTIYINEYVPSSGEFSFYNPDVSGLLTWALENGWKRLRPSNDLAKDYTQFWKYCWETNLVESDYLADQYGEKNKMP